MTINYIVYNCGMLCHGTCITHDTFSMSSCV